MPSQPPAIDGRKKEEKVERVKQVDHVNHVEQVKRPIAPAQYFDVEQQKHNKKYGHNISHSAKVLIREGSIASELRSQLSEQDDQVRKNHIANTICELITDLEECLDVWEINNLNQARHRRFVAEKEELQNQHHPSEVAEYQIYNSFTNQIYVPTPREVRRSIHTPKLLHLLTEVIIPQVTTHPKATDPDVASGEELTLIIHFIMSQQPKTRTAIIANNASLRIIKNVRRLTHVPFFNLNVSRKLTFCRNSSPSYFAMPLLQNNMARSL